MDRVLPDVPLRQWVLSAPFDLRLSMARDASLLTAVVRILCSEIDRLLQALESRLGVVERRYAVKQAGTPLWRYALDERLEP